MTFSEDRKYVVNVSGTLLSRLWSSHSGVSNLEPNYSMEHNVAPQFFARVCTQKLGAEYKTWKKLCQCNSLHKLLCTEVWSTKTRKSCEKAVPVQFVLFQYWKTSSCLIFSVPLSLPTSYFLTFVSRSFLNELFRLTMIHIRHWEEKLRYTLTTSAVQRLHCLPFSANVL